jgi:hypothetical protein
MTTVARFVQILGDRRRAPIRARDPRRSTLSIKEIHVRIEPHFQTAASVVSRGDRHAARPGGFAELIAHAPETAEPQRGSGARASQRTAPDPGSNGTSDGGPIEEIIVTPFGDYVKGAKSKFVTTVSGTEEEIEFKTHAPGEWIRNDAMRAKFAEIYGEKALVTLDWTGTVPDNVDPTWVTNVEVDETGRPLPNLASDALQRKVLS